MWTIVIGDRVYILIIFYWPMQLDNLNQHPNEKQCNHNDQSN